MKKMVCGLLFAVMSITCFSHPIIIDMYDINGSIYLGDAATEQGLEGALNSLIAKSSMSVKNWSEIFEGTFYDFQKFVEKGKVKDKVLSEKAAKEERVSQIRSFVNNHDVDFLGTLGQRLSELTTSALNQNYGAPGAKPEIIFDSFFNTFDFYKANSIEHHIVFRSFGKDIDTAVRATENRLGIKFRKAKFVGDALYLFAQDKPVFFIDKRLQELDMSKTSKDRVAEILAELNTDGLIERKIEDFHEIQKVLTETKYLAVQDFHTAWASKEDWFKGKKFFFPKTNSLGQEILPIFSDDNIESAGSDKGIAHPIQWDANLNKWLSVHPRALLDSQLFIIDTEEAMMDKDYFIKKSVKALSQHYYRRGEKVPQLIYPVKEEAEAKR